MEIFNFDWLPTIKAIRISILRKIACQSFLNVGVRWDSHEPFHWNLLTGSWVQNKQSGSRSRISSSNSRLIDDYKY